MADAGFFEYLEQNLEQVVSLEGELILNREVCERVALYNCEIKYGVVEKDELESNLRQILNLGHTAGRALEALSGYELLHGEAIAIGLAIQVQLAERLGYVTPNQTQRVIALLQKAGLPTEIPATITNRMLIDKMYTDKKVRKGRIRFVFQEGIGSMKRFEDGSYSTPVEEHVLTELLDKIRH